MRAPFALLLAGLGLGWTWLMWSLRAVMTDPYPRVVRWSRAVNVDPNDTQWLAELLDESQAAVRLVLLLLWGVGLVLLLLAGLILARGADED